jgi:hypothetical protein
MGNVGNEKMKNQISEDYLICQSGYKRGRGAGVRGAVSS